MAKSLKAISINFPFKNTSVVCESNFSTARALFDFDLVVVRPYSFLRGALGTPSGGPVRVGWAELSNAKKEITGKTEDLYRFFYQGGLLVVILDVLEILEFRTESYSLREINTVTNYDFLGPHFFRCVRNGSGDRVEYLDPAEPFAKVMKTSSVRWTAFISGSPPDPFNDLKNFAQNGVGSYVGASTKNAAGHIVFLPNFKNLNEGEFFEASLEYRFVREGTSPPAWVPSVFLPGERAAEESIAKADRDLQTLREARDQELKRRDALLSYKRLLFERGKHQLEPIVRKALDDLGFHVSPGENIPGTQYEIDGRTKAGSIPGILEIKGSKKQISLEEFTPFVTKILADLQNTKIQSKGILIANGLCFERPENRMGEVVFSPHVLDASKRHSVALVNSAELYWVICELLSGAISDCAPIREKILTSSGYVDLRTWCKKSPYATKQQSS